ncbi:MAG: hypothetical protein KC502_23575 [Myxococcales bacterium]|nr:hypothetical protein [Myxococcales bacterium]
MHNSASDAHSATHSDASRRALVVGCIVAAAILTTGCKGAGVADYPERKPTPGVASLPDKPNLDPKRSPAQYDDGAWSVRGVVESGTAGRKGEPVTVRGFVAKVKTCPEGQKVCKPAPHLLLTDRKNLRGRRLLVGGELPADVTPGKKLTVVGKMMTASPDGLYFAPGGLLLLTPPEKKEEAAD